MDIAEIVVRIIFGLLFGLFLFVLFGYIPFAFLHTALSTLIGRPFGFGWMRVNAEVRTGEPPADSPYSTVIHKPVFRYAVYEIDGTEYKALLTAPCDSEQCSLFVRQNDPNRVWQPKYPNRLTALAGVICVLGLWAGLVFAGIYIISIARS